MAKLKKLKNKGLILTSSIILFITITLSVTLFFYFYMTSYGSNPTINMNAKNVLLFITDEQISLLNEAPIKGSLSTRSISLSSSDMAANATAMATGVKVKNGNINYRFDQKLDNISDKLATSQKRIGVLSMSNATSPLAAAFTAHNKKFSASSEIASQQLASTNFDILIGIGDAFYKDITVDDNTIYCNNYSQLFNASLSTNKKIVGAIDNTDDSDLLTLTSYCYSKLQNQHGFFMVIDSLEAKKERVEPTIVASQTFLKLNPATVMIIVSNNSYYIYGLNDAEIENKIDNTDIFSIIYQLLT